MKSLNELSKEIHANNEIRGFLDGGLEAKNIGEIIALIHSECSKALEADRKGNHVKKMKLHTILHSGNIEEIISSKNRFKDDFEFAVKNTFEDEMADIIIRVLDVCGAMKIDIEWHIEQKLKYNSLREYKHGKKY
jgi:NTP pyrophosphatase (non-canonical NTP hydrolase)